MSKFALEIPNLPKHLEHYITHHLTLGEQSNAKKKIIELLAVFFSEAGIDFQKPERSIKLYVKDHYYPDKETDTRRGGCLILTEKRTTRFVTLLETMFRDELYTKLDARLEVQLNVNKKVSTLIDDHKVKRNITKKALLSLTTSNIIKPIIEAFILKYDLPSTKKSYETLKKAYWRDRNARKPA